MRLYDIVAPIIDFRDGYRKIGKIVEVARKVEETKTKRPKIILPPEVGGQIWFHCAEMKRSWFYRQGSSLYFTANKDDKELLERFFSSMGVKKRIYGVNS